MGAEILIKALKNIRTLAKGHPAFDEVAYSDRNIERLEAKGGDTCDWTMCAIMADDALGEYGAVQWLECDKA